MPALLDQQRSNALLTVAGATGPHSAHVRCHVPLAKGDAQGNATSPHPKMEENNAKEHLLKRSHVKRSRAPSTVSTNHGETGTFATKSAGVGPRLANANVFSPNTAENHAREKPASRETATSRNVPLTDNGIRGLNGPTVPRLAVEARVKALVPARKLPTVASLVSVTL